MHRTLILVGIGISVLGIVMGTVGLYGPSQWGRDFSGFGLSVNIACLAFWIVRFAAVSRERFRK